MKNNFTGVRIKASNFNLSKKLKALFIKRKLISSIHIMDILKNQEN